MRIVHNNAHYYEQCTFFSNLPFPRKVASMLGSHCQEVQREEQPATEQHHQRREEESEGLVQRGGEGAF
jgi:hypothetical protein